jgi:hypothetical protein
MDFSMEEEEVGPDVTAAPPPTPGRIDILVTKDVITRLDLTPAHEVFRKYVYQIGDILTLQVTTLVSHQRTLKNFLSGLSALC